MVERRRGVRRPEKEEQLARIAEIVEKARSRHGEEHVASSVVRRAKEEGLSTALVFGFFLKAAREKAGLTLEGLGKRVKELGLGKTISGSLVSRFERGERLGQQFPSKRLLSVVAALGAPDDVFWSLMEHYEHVWPETSAFAFQVYGQICLQLSLQDGFVPFDAAKHSRTRKGD